MLDFLLVSFKIAEMQCCHSLPSSIPWNEVYTGNADKTLIIWDGTMHCFKYQL